MNHVNNSIFFSILVPTYNQAEYLKGALESLFKQTYKNWEALVVNDGSTDNTSEILAEYAKRDKRIRVFNKENGGTGSALNEGLKHAKGNWICWLSTDDLFVPEKLEIHKKAIEQFPEVKFFYSNYYVIHGNNDKIIPANDPAYSTFYLPPVQTLGFFWGNYIHGLSIAIHRSIFEELGPFDETIRYAQDFEMWLRIVSKYKAQYIDERTVISRFYDEQITTAHPEWGIWDSTRALYKFLNNHSFEEIFPFLDFNDLSHVFFAVDQTLELSLNKNAFIYKIFYSTALLEKLREWLSKGIRKEFKEIISKRINIFLNYYENYGLLKNLSPNVREVMSTLPKAVERNYTYSSRFFVKELEYLLEQLQKDASHNEEALSKIKLYLTKINEHYQKIISPEKLLPENNLEEDENKSGLQPIEIISSLFRFEADKTTLFLNLSSKKGGAFSVDVKISDVKKIPDFDFVAPKTNERFHFSSKILLESWINGYDFWEAFRKLKEKAYFGNKITIAFTIIDSHIRGGGTSNVFKYASFLNDVGFETSIYSNTKKPSWVKENIRFFKLENHRVRYSKISEDIIIVFSVKELPLLLRQCQCKEKLIFHFCQGVETFHHYNSTYESLISEKEYFRLLHTIPVGRIVVSKSLYNYFKENFGQESILITNGIQKKYFNTKQIPQKEPSEIINVLFVGNPKFFLKGFETFAKAVSIFSKKCPDKKVKVVVLDGSKKKGETEKEILLGIEYESRRCEDVECMAKEYNKADVYVNASFYEGFGLPTIEAMACGTPVIQSNYSGRLDIFKHRENCLLFEPNNHKDLAEKLFELFAKSSLRESLIKKGFKTAELFTEYRQKLEFYSNLKKFIGLLHEYNNQTLVDIKIQELIKIKKSINSQNIQHVDIIILTHNRLKYFYQTIESLIKHTRYPYRIIIVDNASNEEFKRYLKQAEILFDKIIFNEKNEWTSAFQKGIEASDSDPFIVSDPDILVPNLEGKCWLERLVDLHKENPEMGLIALNLDSSNLPEKLPDVYLGEKEKYNDEIILSNVGTVMQAIKRKYFDFPYVTDWETCERIRRNGGKVGFAKNIKAYHLGWNEEKDYPDYLVKKYDYFKSVYGVETYKLNTSDESILSEMENAALLKGVKYFASIIIPVYNQPEYLIQTIESVLNTNSENIEIIIIDNNSDFETQAVLNKISTINKIKILRNDKNLGFPKAVNQGFSIAEGKYIIVANSDIVFTSNWLQKMISHAESDEQIGIVGPVSNRVSGVQLIKNAEYHTIDEMHKFAHKVASEFKREKFEFPRVAFLCTLIKREVIDQIGGLDERFSPGNYEDDDYCLRAQLAGFKTVIAKDVFIHHYGSKSFTAEGNEKYQRLLQTNKQKFVDKWGASPDEIWLQNKKFNADAELFVPITKEPGIPKLIAAANEELSAGKYQTAYSKLTEAVRLYERNGEKLSDENLKLRDILNLTGKVALYLENFDDAKFYFTKELEIGESNARAYESLGDLFIKVKDDENALKCYTVAASFESTNKLKEKIRELEKKVV